MEGCLLDEIKEILTKLFGEEPTGAAVDAYAERISEPIRTGKGRHETGSGRIVVPAASRGRRGVTDAGARHTAA